MMKNGFLLRGFHLHPVMIDLSENSPIRNVNMLREDASDSHFIGHAIGRWSDVHVETDSDDFFMCSLHPVKEARSPPVSRFPALETVRAMAYHSQINPLHRAFFMQAIRIHANDIDDDWDKVEDESGRWAFEALSIGHDTRGARVACELAFSGWRKKRDKFLRKALNAARTVLPSRQ
jgi:hypothetical protein